MYIISKHLKNYWINYIWQSVAAGLVTSLAIYIFSNIVGLLILAGVGSTFFTIFSLPSNRTSQTRNIIGSYIISVIVGMICYNIFPTYISGGLAIGLAAFLMVITDTEHPPAAGIALGLAVAANNNLILKGSMFAILGAFLASLVRYLLRPWLKDLV